MTTPPRNPRMTVRQATLWLAKLEAADERLKLALVHRDRAGVQRAAADCKRIQARLRAAGFDDGQRGQG